MIVSFHTWVSLAFEWVWDRVQGPARVQVSTHQRLRGISELHRRQILRQPHLISQLAYYTTEEDTLEALKYQHSQYVFQKLPSS